MDITVRNYFGEKRFLGKSRRVSLKATNDDEGVTVIKLKKKKTFNSVGNTDSIYIFPHHKPTVYPDVYWIVYPEELKYDEFVLFHPDSSKPGEDYPVSGKRRQLKIEGKKAPAWWIEIKNPGNISSATVTIGDGNQIPA